MYEEYNRLLSFCSLRHAFRAEELLTQARIKVETIPMPREIDVNCGQCILFMAEKQDQVMALLKEKNVFWSQLFDRDGVNKNYEKVAEFEDNRL